MRYINYTGNKIGYLSPLLVNQFDGLDLRSRILYFYEDEKFVDLLLSLLNRVHNGETKIVFDEEYRKILNHAKLQLDLPLLNVVLESDKSWLLKNLIIEGARLEVQKEKGLVGIEIDTSLLYNCIKTNDDRCITWLQKKNIRFDSKKIAIEYDDLNLFKKYFLVEDSKDDLHTALNKGSKSIVDYLSQTNQSLDLFMEAVRANNLDSLKYVMNNYEGKFSPFVCEIPSLLGNLEMLQFLILKGLPITDRVYDYARYNRHSHILEWLNRI